jgi:hypothetical protein
MRPPARAAAAAAALALLAALPGAQAAQSTPAAHIARELPRARLAGQGGYSWFGLNIYQAQLWVGEQGYRGGAPEAAPFVLDLRYQRALDGGKIAEASAEQMRKIGAGGEAQRQAWLRTMQGIFPDVKEGAHISGAYLPGAGARFYLDGKLLAEVPDAAFARAFFAIWLDPASSAGKLREALLLDAAPRP